MRGRRLLGGLLLTTVTGVAQAEPREICRTGDSGANLRSIPSIHGTRVGAIAEGIEIDVIETSPNGRWVRARVDEQVGWISSDYVCEVGELERTATDEEQPFVPEAAREGSPLGPVVVPIVGGCRSSKYGNRRDPFHRRWVFHDGTDFAADGGTPLVAAFSGTVVRAGRTRGYGYAVVIRHDHPDGSATFALYGHLCCGRKFRYGRSSIRVQPGDEVAAGQMIAQVGTTGRSTGPHLHLTIREVPRSAPNAYRNPNLDAFYERAYSVDPERYVSVPPCGARVGVGGDGDRDHDHGHGHGHGGGYLRP